MLLRKQKLKDGSPGAFRLRLSMRYRKNEVAKKYDIGLGTRCERTARERAIFILRTLLILGWPVGVRMRVGNQRVTRQWLDDQMAAAKRMDYYVPRPYHRGRRRGAAFSPELPGFPAPADDVDNPCN